MRESNLNNDKKKENKRLKLIKIKKNDQCQNVRNINKLFAFDSIRKLENHFLVIFDCDSLNFLKFLFCSCKLV